MAERSKAESFTAFLEAREKQKSQAAPAHAPGPVPAQSGTPLSLLFTLADSPRSEMKLSDLQASSGMSFEAFAESLKSLSDSRYVTVTGTPGSEMVVLTALGQDVSRLARPVSAHP